MDDLLRLDTASRIEPSPPHDGDDSIHTTTPLPFPPPLTAPRPPPQRRPHHALHRFSPSHRPQHTPRQQPQYGELHNSSLDLLDTLFTAGRIASLLSNRDVYQHTHELGLELASHDRSRTD